MNNDGLVNDDDIGLFISAYYGWNQPAYVISHGPYSILTDVDTYDFPSNGLFVYASATGGNHITVTSSVPKATVVAINGHVDHISNLATVGYTWVDSEDLGAGSGDPTGTYVQVVDSYENGVSKTYADCQDNPPDMEGNYGTPWYSWQTTTSLWGAGAWENLEQTNCQAQGAFLGDCYIESVLYGFAQRKAEEL